MRDDKIDLISKDIEFVKDIVQGQFSISNRCIRNTIIYFKFIFFIEEAATENYIPKESFSLVIS